MEPRIVIKELTKQLSFADGYVTTTGLAITKVHSPMPIFGGGSINREMKKNKVLAKLTAFFNKFYNV